MSTEYSGPFAAMAKHMGWTRITDMHTGGGRKTHWDVIYIQASEEVARTVFEQRFEGVDLDASSCNCCGPDFSVSYWGTPDDEGINAKVLHIYADQI